MNAEQRKRLEDAVIALETAKGTIDEILFSEQEEFDGLSDEAQEGAKGEKLGETIQYLEDASSYVNDAMERIGEAKA
jgi:hypothetical protein